VIQLDKIRGFDWDAGNESKNQDKHAVAKLEAEEVFFNTPLLILEDKKHSDKEPRFHALGKTDAARLLHLTYTLRGDKVRVISARDMHRKERRYYEENS